MHRICVEVSNANFYFDALFFRVIKVGGDQILRVGDANERRSNLLPMNVFLKF